MSKGKVIVAPLNWGIGHATRCIPIIKALLQTGYLPVLASNGEALKLLQQEFPNLDSFSLPDYGVTYSKTSNGFKWHMFKQLPTIQRAIKKEHRVLKAYVKNHDIIGVISDNRLGMYHKAIPSIIITHQLSVLSGSTTRFSTWAHQNYLKRFNAVWVPDYNSETNLSGVLGHAEGLKSVTTYIGPLSRLEFNKELESIPVVIVLSGPEPQRSLLKDRLLNEFKSFSKPVVMVLGKVEAEVKTYKEGNITVYNYVLSEQLNSLLSKAELVVCRSGYSSIMDLAILKKKVLFIPTPGQSEQMYLAEYLKVQNCCPYVLQDNFTLKDLELVKNYKGFTEDFTNDVIDFEALFSRFFNGE